MKFGIFLAFILLSFQLHPATSNNIANLDMTINGWSVASADEPGGHETGEHEHSGGDHGHNTSMFSLFFIIMALLTGAATRHFLRKSPLPYTVMLLLIGLIAGVLVRLGYFEQWHLGSWTWDLGIVSKSVHWAANIDPHLLLYVFLPILIFEAAFAMDVHTFKKSVTNAVLLAVPGIIVALVLTAALAMGLKALGVGFSAWTWPLALMFGAVVSATDPVAVVALLKELGASKKLGTLIEGESLLNDGTAIVLFMVFFLGLTGAAPEGSPIIEFARVSLGGVTVGLVIGWISITWLKKVFNDALVEISVIIGAAYLTFFLAEHFFHVSGVLALVALGLVMASIGRTRISPEVEHFMHEFWELAGFIANTLLFLIVGVVIAERSIFSLYDFIILVIIYIGIHVVRAIVILMLFPLMRKAGYGLPKKDAYVVWYGALRGAIGLALALIVAGVDEQYISAEIRNQFLFYTAGIVTLTLLVNATTIKFLIGALGLTSIPPAKQLMIHNAHKYLRSSTTRALEKIKKNRYMNKANWKKVEEYFPETMDQEELTTEIHVETSVAETRRRVLEKEKSSYWSQFREGMLGAEAVNRLSDTINEIIDAGGTIALSDRKDLEQEWRMPALLSKVHNWPVLGRLAERFFFDRLVVSYDSAVGFVMAQEEALKLIDSIALSEKDEGEKQKLEIIEGEINTNRIHGLTFLRNIRNSYPEIYSAIATRQAIRSMLNAELHTVERLVKRGRIDSGEAGKMIADIEKRMKGLLETPPSFELPKSKEMLRSISWLKDIEDAQFAQIADLFQNRIYSVGQHLVKENGPADGLFVIVRGKVKVSVGDDKVMDILGAGNVVGEMSVLTGHPRSATVTAESPVTVLWITRTKMRKAMKLVRELESRLWNFASARFVENLLGQVEPYNIWNQSRFREWIHSGTLWVKKEGETIELKEQVGVLLEGQIFRAGDRNTVLRAPEVLFHGDVIAEGQAKVFFCATNQQQGTSSST